MKYIIKNKTIKNIVFLVDGNTRYLFPKGDPKGRDELRVNQLTGQMKNAKSLKFIQISKVEN